MWQKPINRSVILIRQHWLTAHPNKLQLNGIQVLLTTFRHFGPSVFQHGIKQYDTECVKKVKWMNIWYLWLGLKLIGSTNGKVWIFDRAKTIMMHIFIVLLLMFGIWHVARSRESLCRMLNNIENNYLVSSNINMEFIHWFGIYLFSWLFVC